MKTYIPYFLIAGLALLSACSKSSETTYDVAYWKDPNNKAAFDAKLAECKNNPAKLSADANCINIIEAQSKLFRKKLFN